MFSQSTFGCSHSSESVWWRLTDGTSGRSVKVLGDQGILDWVWIWALPRPLQNIQLVVFDLFLCVWGRRLWWVAVFFFSFCAAIVFCTGNTANLNGPSRNKFFYSTLNCTQVISVLLISVSRTSVELVQWIFKQRIPTARWPESVCSLNVEAFFLNSFFNFIEHDFMYKNQTRGPHSRRGWIIHYIL